MKLVVNIRCLRGFIIKPFASNRPYLRISLFFSCVIYSFASVAHVCITPNWVTHTFRDARGHCTGASPPQLFRMFFRIARISIFREQIQLCSTSLRRSILVKPCTEAPSTPVSVRLKGRIPVIRTQLLCFKRCLAAVASGT